AADVEVLRHVVELVARALFEPGARVARALRALVRSAAFLAASLVHRACCDLLRAVLADAAVLLAFLDVLVLALVLRRPLASRHGCASFLAFVGISRGT